MSKSRYMPKYFRYSEFDSKDAPGTGVNMQDSTLMMLDEARRLLNRPIIVRDGFRTRSRQLALIRQFGANHAAQNSAHELGYAADLEAIDLQQSKNLVTALYNAGFRRFGIMETSIHVDNDPARPTPAIWTYPTTSNRRYDAIRQHIKSLQTAPQAPEPPPAQSFGKTEQLTETLEIICKTLQGHAEKNGIKFTYTIENA